MGKESLDYLDRMQHAAGRMSGLIAALLTYSRVANIENSLRPVKLASVAEDAVSNLEVLIERTGARVEIGSMPTINADPDQMRQLFQNLIANSLKYCKENEPPVVRVYCLVENDICQVIVEDNGIGFDEIYLDRIFRPFQRLHGRSTYDGMGMGLAICKKIVERHGGGITAKSTPGIGSTFIFKLPIGMILENYQDEKDQTPPQPMAS